MSPSCPAASSGLCLQFDHITFWVSNAKQAASFYTAFLGFRPLAHKGLETGSRAYASHAVAQQEITLLFVSSLSPEDEEFARHLQQHGDCVKDIAFTVDDVDAIVDSLSRKQGVRLLRHWQEEDQDGVVKFATIASEGDMTHTLVQRNQFSGLFLPGFRETRTSHVAGNTLPAPGLQFIDHCVATRYENSIDSARDWYEKNLSFHRFWSVEDLSIETTKSSLKFLVVTNKNEKIKMTILEPAKGNRVSQVQEFNEYNGGPGIQHIALHTEDIVQSEWRRCITSP